MTIHHCSIIVLLCASFGFGVRAPFQSNERHGSFQLSPNHLRIGFIRNGGVYLYDSGAIRLLSDRDTSAGFSGISASHEKLAVISRMDRALYTVAPPTWKPVRVGNLTGFFGSPRWFHDRDTYLLAGRSQKGADLDDGLWKASVRDGRMTRLLSPIDADACVNDRVRVAPDGKRIAAGGGMTFHAWIRVLDIRSKQKPIWIANEELGIHDFEWLTASKLMIASGPDEFEGKVAAGGIRLYDVDSQCTHHWMYGRKSNIAQIVRSPNGEMIAVGRQPTYRSETKFGTISAIIEIVRLGSGKTLRLAGLPPAHICGFISDNKHLLAIVPRHARDREKGQLCLVSLSKGKMEILVDDVDEAVLMH